MLARADAAPDVGGALQHQQQQQQQQQQCLVVVKSLLSSASHHQLAFEHEAEMFSRARHANDRHIVRMLGVCCSLQPALIVTEYCELVRIAYLHTTDLLSASLRPRFHINKLQLSFSTRINTERNGWQQVSIL